MKKLNDLQSNHALRRWLTPDPIGTSNHSNLYQYLFNSPFLYQDDNGEFAIPLLMWGAEMAIPVISTYITAIAYGSAAGAIAYGGYKLVKAANQRNDHSVEDGYFGGMIIPNIFMLYK